MYYFYILYSQERDRYYIGHTNQLEDRLYRHNINHKGFTGKQSDWHLVYSEPYETKAEAYARERQVKKWKNRLRVEALIHRNSSVGPDKPEIYDFIVYRGSTKI